MVVAVWLRLKVHTLDGEDGQLCEKEGRERKQCFENNMIICVAKHLGIHLTCKRNKIIMRNVQ